MIFVQLVGLMLLHGPDGHEILLNPKTVATMRAAQLGRKNKTVAEQTQCLINTTDGKFITVIETCDMVRQMMKEKP